ncbi:MAG: hypothetical protein ACI4ER_02245 [Suilimivivens sp.]
MIVFEVHIPNIKYAYKIEELDNGLYSLIFQKWDDGRGGWNYNFPPGFADLHDGIHLYNELEKAKSDGNIFLISNAGHKILEIDTNKIVWFWNEGESNASKMPVNNLIIYNNSYQQIWKIDNFLGYDEMCTGISQKSKSTFYFCTFMGLGFTMEISGEKITCLKKTLIK